MTTIHRDAGSATKELGLEPFIHPTASVRDSRLGAWTEVGARTTVAEVEMGDYSYVVHDAQIIYATIGRFCSIASHTRINPGNHPLDRVALSHFTYRASAYGLGEDEAGFFDWRRSHRVNSLPSIRNRPAVDAPSTSGNTCESAWRFRSKSARA